ncbi:MAG: heparan-alpha-glucosaminide N-acetyltransferase domain-containing protein [Verrucomicrobiota bacterium]|nr:heparan-alpha-glucosaminide N-acetyltransferase domain-containing protein [Verrucomicrobiota bacterium]
MPNSTNQSAAEPRVRVESVDVLRGLVMVIMALDHVRDFFSGYTGGATNAATAPGMIFFTRWITHLCAPTFVFLAGTSIYLQFLSKPRPQLTRFLLTRGLWLMALEIVVVTAMLTFHPSVHFLFLQVIWVTGISMIVMAALIYLPLWVVTAFGAVLVLTHNAFDSVTPATMGAVAGTVWRLLHVPGLLLPPTSGYFWVNLYPLIPWPGIMALGFAFGFFLQRPPAQRQRAMLLLGLGSLAVFVLLRWSNLYGDPVRWKPQVSGLRTFLSFMDVQKYPPSLLYVLATLGLSLCLMAAFDAWQAREIFQPARSILSVYGRVPFFYYVLHFTSIHLAALLTTAAMGLNWRWWIALPPAGSIFAGQPRGWGFALPIVYLVWLLIVALCYFPCRWFAGVKQRNRSPWLSYL